MSIDTLRANVNQGRALGVPCVELVDSLNALAYALQEVDRAECQSASKEALSIAFLLKYSEGEARAHTRLGWLSCLAGELDVAMRHGVHAETLAHLSGNVRLQLGVLYVTASVHQRVNNTAFALRDLYKMLHLALQAGDTEYEADTYTALGVLYRGQGDYSEAIDNHKRAVRRYFDLVDLRETVALNNVAFAYADANDGVQALMYARMALDKCPLDWVRLRASILDTMGRACLALNNPRLAQAQFDSGIKVYQTARMLGQLHADSIIAALYQGVAQAQRKLGHLDQAARHLELALTEAERAQDKPLQADIHEDWAELLSLLGAHDMARHHQVKATNMKATQTFALAVQREQVLDAFREERGIAARRYVGRDFSRV